MTRPPQCTYLLFVATQSEREAVERVANELRLSFRRKNSDIGRYFDLGFVGLSRVLVVQTHMGPFSARGSAAKAIVWIAATQAQAVIGVGMAFGTLPNQQMLGDVLVSTGVLPYDYKIVRSNPIGNPVIDYSQVPTHPAREALVTLFGRAAFETERLARVHLGLFLSGAARIHCSVYRDELRDAFPDRGLIIGGEMEGVGLLALSSQEELAPDSRWIIVKGISDFADGISSDIFENSRITACQNAAKFVLSALQREEALRA